MIKKSNTKFVKRQIYSQISGWLDEPEIIAISGPRQAGKTTLLKQLQDDLKQKSFYFNFEKTSVLESFIDSPEDFIKIHLKNKSKAVFLFDEFQYVPQAGKKLKLLYDQFKQIKFVITGSASLKIKEIASFLVGRIVFFHLYPFSWQEFLSTKEAKYLNQLREFKQIWGNFIKKTKIDLPSKKIIFKSDYQSFLNEYLTYGGYPAIVLSSLDKKEKRLRSLVETYIEKDIVGFLRIGDFLEFKNFTKLLAVQTGGLINYASLQTDSGLSYRRVKQFLSTLEQTFVIKLLKPFFKNKSTEIKKSPKPYFIDLGLKNSLINDFRDPTLKKDQGLIVENFALIQFINNYSLDRINFWRTKQKAEVDFIFKQENQLIPIEIKYRQFNQPRISRSLRSFINTYQPKKAIVVSKNFYGWKQINNTQIMFYPIYFV